MHSTRYSCQVLIKIEFSRQIFKKYSNVKCNENPSGGSRIVVCGQRDRQAGSRTDRHDEANNLRTRLKNKTFVLDTKLWVWQKDSVTELAYCCIDFNFVHHFLILGLKDRLNSGPSLLQKSFEAQRYMTAFILFERPNVLSNAEIGI